jgi:hypothetical protein
VGIETPSGWLRPRARLVPGLGDDRVNAERWWYPERPAGSLFGLHESNVSMHLEASLDDCDPAYGTLPFRVARCRLVPEPNDSVASAQGADREAAHG